MAGLAAAVLVLGAVIALCVTVVWPRSRPAWRGRGEVGAARPAPGPGGDTMDVSVWPIGWPHEAPEGPMSVNEAHAAMQRHRSCRRDECPRKRAAYQALVEAGRIRPDSGRVP